VSGLSQDARDVLEVIRGIDLASREAHPQIHRNEIDEVLGRAHGNQATQHALNELDEIGDLENVTRIDPSHRLVSFTLA
jgi:hypothetical protein